MRGARSRMTLLRGLPERPTVLLPGEPIPHSRTAPPLSHHLPLSPWLPPTVFLVFPAVGQVAGALALQRRVTTVHTCGNQGLRGCQHSLAPRVGRKEVPLAVPPAAPTASRAVRLPPGLSPAGTGILRHLPTRTSCVRPASGQRLQNARSVRGSAAEPAWRADRRSRRTRVHTGSGNSNAHSGAAAPALLGTGRRRALPPAHSPPSQVSAPARSWRTAGGACTLSSGRWTHLPRPHHTPCPTLPPATHGLRLGARSRHAQGRSLRGGRPTGRPAGVVCLEIYAVGAADTAKPRRRPLPTASPDGRCAGPSRPGDSVGNAADLCPARWLRTPHWV